MAEGADTELCFWKRISLFLAIGLVAAVTAICAVVAVFSIKIAQHELELSATRAQLEKERDIAIKMWQVADATLTRERKRPASVGATMPVKK